MKKAVQKLFAVLMALVMFFDAAPVAAAAEEVQTEGQSALEQTLQDMETPIITDVTEGKRFDVSMPEEPSVEESHTLEEGEYSITPVDDPSGLLDLIDSQLQPDRSVRSKARAMKAASVNNTRQIVSCVAYNIELTEDAVAALEYNVTVPVHVDMLENYRDPEQPFDISGIRYQLYHIHTDENDSTSVEEIEAVSVNGENGWIEDFTFTVDSFSSFVLKYTVDFAYRIKRAEISIDFAKENSSEVPHISYDDTLHFTALAVADILADAPVVSDDSPLQDEVYTVSLGDDAAKDDFNEAFFADPAIEIAGSAVSYQDGAILLTGDVEEGSVTFISGFKILDVAIANYIAPPIIPQDTEGFAYRFFEVGEQASVAEILKNCGIIASYYESATVSDPEKVTVQEDTLTAEEYFDEAILTVVLSDGSEVVIALMNPAPIEAGTVISTEGVGSFIATDKVPAGTQLVVETEPDVPFDLELDSGAKRTGSEESGTVFFGVSLIGPDGQPVETGAEVTIATNIELPVKEEQITKVKEVKVYHIGEKGDAEPLEGAAYSLGEGKISSVTFTTPGFSLFAVTYTVEFIEKGKTYSIVGGGVISLRELLDALDVQGIQVEEIENAAFSDEELVKVVQVDEDTTAGELKQKLALSPSYSAELTGEDIAAMDALALTAPDWALISLAPFKTDEKLIITLTDGQEYEIAVTDGQIVRYYIDSKGDTYEITVTYEDDAEIPEDAELAVSEILPEDEQFDTYLAQALQAVAGEEAVSSQYARFFDITIMNGEEKVTPKAPVIVTIALADAPEGKELKVVHFDEENGLVVMEAERTNADFLFAANSFSVYGVIAMPEPVGANNLDGRSAKIKRGSYYVQSNTNINSTADNTYLLNNSQTVDEAAVWHFEATNNGTYYIFTEEGSNRSYLNLTQNNSVNNRAHASMTGNPQEFTIALENGSYVISANVSGTTYYLNQHYGTEGFGGYSARSVNGDNDVFSFEFEPNLATDLANRTFKLHSGDSYMTSIELSGNDNSGVTRLDTGTNAQGAIWLFEDSGQEGKYYISTIVESIDGSGNKQYEKKYLHLTQDTGTWYCADASLSSEPQLYNVELASNGNYYISTIFTEGGNPFYLSSRMIKEPGFTGFHTADKSRADIQMALDFTNPTITGEESDPEKYMLLVKYEGSYYIVHNDGTLMPVDDPDHVTGQFEIDDPMVWLYDGSNLYHRHKETGFQGNNLASDFYYRYIDPESDSGLFDEDASNTPTHKREPSYQGQYIPDYDLLVTSRPMKEYTQITYQNNHISSQNNPLCYIGIVNDNGQLKIVGNQSEGNAAEIYFTKMLLEDQMVYNDLHHTVNHIDISIEGHATISAPLAYGTYYYNDGTGVKTLIVTRDNPITLEIAQEVNISMEDVMRANVSAYTIDENGTHHPIDNAFHISGFSGNHENDTSKNQTRIEGVFKVADRTPIDENDSSRWEYGHWENAWGGRVEYDGVQRQDPSDGQYKYGDWWNNNFYVYHWVPTSGRPTPSELTARLNNRIYYTVSTTKQIDVELKYNNFLLYETYAAAEANTGDGVKKGQATVTLGNSFNYWDLRNECPPLNGNREGWQRGEIIDVSSGADTGSGMDFQLGTDDKDKFGILAVEITKFIMDPSGSVITPKTNVENTFYIYHLNACPANSTVVNQTAVASVAGMDVNAYASGNQALLDGNGTYDYNQYSYKKSKSTVVGVGGTSSIYDYDIPAGMVYIEEDASESSLPRIIEDADGRIWNYRETRIETEYVWRGDQYSGLHVSDKYHLDNEGEPASRYLSHPEVLGNYTANDNSSCYNGFLEFYVYNIYEPEDISIPVKKVWKHQNGSLASGQADASIDVELGRYKLVDDTENPATGTVTINHSVSGSGNYSAVYELWQGNKLVRSASYDNGSLTFYDVPQGVYTLKVTESAEGYDIATSIDSLPGASKVISVTTGETTAVAIRTVLTQIVTPNMVSLTVINRQLYNGGYNEEFNASYSFPEGGTVVITIYRPSAKFNLAADDPNYSQRFVVEYSLDGGTTFSELPWPTESAGQWTYVYQDWELTLTGNANVIFRHNWGSSDCKITGVALKDGNIAPAAPATPTPTPAASVSAPTAAPASGSVSYVSYTGGVPDTRIPGKKYVDDPEFKEFVTLGNGNWEDTVNGLPAVDDNGYQYVYYIRSAEEHGIVNPLESKPTIESLVSMGETTLEITNTVPNEKPVVTVRKVDENGYPLTGAVFTLTKGGESKTFTVSNPDGTCLLTWDNDGLPDGNYILTESGSLTGYKALDGNISFTVAENDIVQNTINSTSSNITFDRANFTITVKNEPDIPEGSLRVAKSWLDINGNVLASHPSTANFKLVQMAQNEGEEHELNVEFYVLGNDSGNQNRTDYENKVEQLKDSRSASGRGSAVMEWVWESHCSIGKSQFTITGIPENCYNIETWVEESITHVRLTIYDDGSGQRKNVKVVIDNYNFNPFNSPTGISNISWAASTRPGDGYSLVPGGEMSFTLGDAAGWSRTFNYNGDGVLSASSGDTLPATYYGRACRYIIVEEGVDTEHYSVSYSSNNALGLGQDDVASLTAYNRKITTSVNLIKVDQTNHTIKLAGAEFKIFKINPDQPRLTYMDWSYSGYPSGSEVVTTDANGQVTFTDLEAGYYEIQEVKAPTNYRITADGCFYIKLTTGGVSVIEKEDNVRPSKWRVHPNDSYVIVNRSDITIGNEPDYGALLIEKAVTVNGQTPTDANKGLLNGTFTFSIVGDDNPSNFAAGEEHTLEITFENGKMVSYKIDRDLPVTLTETEIEAGTLGSGQVLVPDLKPGTYTITETSAGGLTLTAINGTTVTASNSITAVVTAGQSSNPAGVVSILQVTFTNNLETGALKLQKIVTVNGKDESQWGSDEDRRNELASFVDGAYLFSITGPASYAEEDRVTKYVWIVVVDGDMSTYRVFDDLSNDGTRYTDDNGDKGWWYTGYTNQFTSINGNTGWVTVDNLPVGEYVLKEEAGYSSWSWNNDGDWWIDEHKPLSEVLLKNVTNGNGDQGDLSHSSITLTVAHGSTVAPTAQASFTNNYDEPGALKLKKIMLDHGSGTVRDGAFDFSIASADDTSNPIKYVRIIVYEGNATYYDVQDTAEGLSSHNWGWVDDGGDYWRRISDDKYVTIGGLPAGDYVITEIASHAVETGSRVWNADGNSYGTIEVTTNTIPAIYLESITGGKLTNGQNDAVLDNGTVTVTVAPGDAAASSASAYAIFTNSTPYVNVPFKAKKTLTGGTLGAGDYTFTLTQTDSSWNALENGISQTKTNAAPETGNNNADVLFDDVKFTTAGTYYFILSETTGNDASIVYDGHQQKVTVTVTADADADGRLTAEKTYEPAFSEEGYDASFTNRKASLILKKTVEADTNAPVGGTIAYTDGTYTFTVAGPTDGTSATHTVVITVANGAMTGATLDGMAITAETVNAAFDAADGVKLIGLTPGTYTVTEDTWSITGCTNADMYLKNITVSPTDTVDLANKTAAVTVADNATVSVEFTNKLEPNVPNLEKQVTNLNDSADTISATFRSESPWNKSADYDIGDQVPYRVTTYLPSNYYRAQNEYTYIIHDTMNHLKYVSGSGKMYAFVKSDSDGDTGAWYDVTSWFTIGEGAYAGSQQTITVYPMDSNNLKKVTTGCKVTNWGADTHGDDYPYKAPTLADSTNIVNADIRYLQFRYKAELKPDANIGSSKGNTNTAYLEFSDSPSTTSNTGLDTNVVYTYKLVVNKTDEYGGALTGAQFQLFKKYLTAPAGASSTAQSFTGRTGIHLYGLASTVTSLDMSNLTSTVPDGNYYLVSGTVSGSKHDWTGIDDGYYILVETQAPTGYTGLAEPIGFVINTTLESSVAGFRSGYVNVYTDGKWSLFTNRDLSLTTGITAAIPNTMDKKGSLTVTKNIVETTADGTEVFTFTVTLTPPTGVPLANSYTTETTDGTTTARGTAAVTSNVITLTLHAGESCTIIGLPAGTAYLVSETNVPSGWVQAGDVAYNDDTKTITANDSDTATVTNVPSISINVTKVWTKDNSARNDQPSISFKLHQVLTPENGGASLAPTVYTDYGNNGDGTVNYTDKGWQTVTIPNLPLTVIRPETSGEEENQTTTNVAYHASYYVVETGTTADAGYVLATTYTNGTTTNADGSAVTVDTNESTITIINTETPGVELPATGGPGTASYTITGLTLMLLGAIWMLLLRRREKN